MILPGTGRGTATRSGVVEGVPRPALCQVEAPSTMLRMVPLPVPGRIVGMVYKRLTINLRTHAFPPLARILLPRRACSVGLEGYSSSARAWRRWR